LVSSVGVESLAAMDALQKLLFAALFFIQAFASSSLDDAIASPSSSPSTSLSSCFGVMVYVYGSADDLPAHFTNPNNVSNPIDISLYASEQRLHRASLSHACRTINAAQADYFYIPAYPSMLAHFKLGHVGFEYALLPETYQFLAQVEAWLDLKKKRSGSSNNKPHLLAIAHDIGSCLAPFSLSEKVIFLQTYNDDEEEAKDVTRYLERSTDPSNNDRRQLLHRPSQGPCFNATKDIVIPPFIGEREQIARDEAAASNPFHKQQQQQRDWLLYFRGSVYPDEAYSGGIRQWMKKQSAAIRNIDNNDDSSNDSIGLDDEQHFYFDLLSDKKMYWRELRRSVFCICVGGWVNWSPRLYQSVAAGCIPVFIVTNKEEKEGDKKNEKIRTFLPFEDTINYSEFSLSFSFDELKNGEMILRLRALKEGNDDTAGGNNLKAMQEKLRSAWRMYTYSWNYGEKIVYKSSTNEGGGVLIESSGGAFDEILNVLRNRRRIGECG
jgi:hypothetical protein